MIASRGLGSRVSLCTILAVGLVNAPAQAGYILTPLSGGSSTLDVQRGETFVLDLHLTSDASDTHLSSEFLVLFSQAGLMYVEYSWGTGYTTGGIDDVSVPFIDDLPALIDGTSYGSPSDVDLYFSNLTDDGQVFAEGIIVSLTLMLPSNWEPLPDSINISALPDLFFDGFTAIPTTAGPAFTLNIIPAPPTAILLASVFLLGRRRRR